MRHWSVNNLCGQDSTHSTYVRLPFPARTTFPKAGRREYRKKERIPVKDRDGIPDDGKFFFSRKFCAPHRRRQTSALEIRIIRLRRTKFPRWSVPMISPASVFPRSRRTTPQWWKRKTTEARKWKVHIPNETESGVAGHRPFPILPDSPPELSGPLSGRKRSFPPIQKLKRAGDSFFPCAREKPLNMSQRQKREFPSETPWRKRYFSRRTLCKRQKNRWMQRKERPKYKRSSSFLPWSNLQQRCREQKMASPTGFEPVLPGWEPGVLGL